MKNENKKSFSLSFNSSLPALLLVLLIYCFMVLTKHHYVRLTADSMLYFSLAEKYLSGDFTNAINGYWGPLLAWLLVPFLYLGTSHVFAINALNLVLGILIIFGVWRLSYVFRITETIRSIILVSLLPIVLKFSVVQPMDTLLVCMLIYYLLFVLRENYHASLLNGLLCGFFGALSYFSKAYAFPFFIVHFLIMNILHYFKNTSTEDRKNVLRNAIAGFLLFSLISGAWIMVISDKYGHITFSTMRDTNFNAPGPDDMEGGLEFGVPVFSEGFYEPPNETAFVIWEDPSYLRGKPWSPWDSPRHFKHFIRLTLKNISDGLKIFEAFSTFSIVIIVAYILLCCVRSKEKLLSKGAPLYPLFTLILFSGGFVLFHFEDRYVWLSDILLLLMGGHLLTLLFEEDFFRSGSRKNILILFFVISFIFVPSKYVIQVGRGGMDTDMYLMSTDLIKHNISGNIASNRDAFSHDAWHKTFRLAYWLGSRYYGQPRANISDNDLQKELDKYGIDYYFFWGESKNAPQFLNQYRELTGGDIPGLNVYSLKDLK